ncbi:type VI secretion system-associated FHA domain protein TagH [Alkalimarinus alittae]|uniref:Type VI secretion system-associated FHA domain protein TagH n=1 Tax=Alkalimarinus alittae TaxID=2961619 RepID=A0ABY6N5D1_9ALTE|nr:type VI secretion system-associated FHA domain protein TagH [Alkalimarinus alittae]UZE97333.1 type VI secretion system-associated FHA domain protein TagH [Alkalimarinus alittae]
MDLLFRIEPVQSEALLDTDSAHRDASFTNLSADNHFTFSPLGGLIGRSTECDWVLADPDLRLSGKHAAISFEHHQYQITDLSTNGLFVNDQLEPLGKGNTHAINTGDRFVMGPFCMVASVANAVNTPDIDLTEMLTDEEGIQPLMPDDSATDEISLVEHEHLISANGTSFDDLLEFPTPKQEEPVPLEVTDQANVRREPAEPVSSHTIESVALPPCNNPPTVSAKRTLHHTAEPSDRGDKHLPLFQFLRGAGLDDELLLHPELNELMFNFGALLKRYTGEIMKLMGERSRYKNQCRLDMTLVAAEHNNPLKYCVNEVQALREMIISPQRENLSGGQAIESAMEDIRDHFSRVEKGYQGTLSSLIDFIGMTDGKTASSAITPHKKQPTQTLSNMPWHYRKRLKQLQQKTAMLKDPGYYSDEFFSPRFAYFYQNPERANQYLDSATPKTENPR